MMLFMQRNPNPKDEKSRSDEEYRLLKELVHTEENSTKEAIIAYDNSIKRLQSVLTIEGVILPY